MTAERKLPVVTCEKCGEKAEVDTRLEKIVCKKCGTTLLKLRMTVRRTVKA